MGSAPKRMLRRLDAQLLGGRLRRLYRRRLKFAGSNLPRLGPGAPFPDPRAANAAGIVALGGDLAPERLLAAYHQGLFPLFQPGEPIQWWSPDPRCVLFPASAHVSRRLREQLRKGLFTVTFDHEFDAIVAACRDVRRGDTWITDEVVAGYGALRERGAVHSVEVWEAERLVGGLYGVSLGGFFAVESMFSLADNASKAALLVLASVLREHGFVMIDCQFQREHFARLGAVEIPRQEFLRLLARATADSEAARAWPALSTTTFAVRDVVR